MEHETAAAKGIIFGVLSGATVWAVVIYIALL
jgi:hypothetical protein